MKSFWLAPEPKTPINPLKSVRFYQLTAVGGLLVFAPI